VHGCLEGPESGVYYRDKASITNHKYVEIVLPNYVSKIATNFTIQITPIYTGPPIKSYNVTELIDNKFSVYGDNGPFYWIVHGKRLSIEVEPDKKSVEVKGSGPYKWI
jgi:hypothetical protein